MAELPARLCRFPQQVHPRLVDRDARDEGLAAWKSDREAILSLEPT